MVKVTKTSIEDSTGKTVSNGYDIELTGTHSYALLILLLKLTPGKLKDIGIDESGITEILRLIDCVTGTEFMR